MNDPAPGTGPAGTARRLLGRLGVDLHPGEAPTVLALFGAFFLCLCFQYATKAVRQSTFVDTFGAERLPLVYLAVALLAVPVVYLYGRLADRLQPARLTVLTSALTAAGLVLFWWLYGQSAAWVPAAFYLWITTVIALNLSQIWACAAQRFDPRQARRLFALLGAGALMGGIAGGQVARLASELAETRVALLAAAVALVAAAALVAVADRPRDTDRPRDAGPAPAAPARSLAEVGRSPHLRLIAIVFGLSIVVAQIVDLQFNWVVEQATSGLDRRTAFFGNFYSITGLAAVLFQLLLAARIHRGLGIGFSLRVLPLSLGAGTVALLLAGGLLPGLVLAAGLALKVSENGLRYSLDQATRELLFLPLPDRLRNRAKAVIDILVQRGAKGVAALLLLPVVFGWLGPVDAGWMSLALIAVWVALVPALYRRYVDAYRESLSRETVDPGLPIDLGDVRTLEIVIQSLGSTDHRQVLHGLELLASHGRGHLVPPLLLYHDHPAVRRATLTILADSRRDDSAPLVERLLGDSDPEVRAAAIRVLASLRHVDAGALMLPRLGDADPAVRAAAIACIANIGEPESASRAALALRDMLRDEDPETRIEAARCLGAVAEPANQDELLQLLYDREAAVVQEAIGSVRRRLDRDGANSIYLPTLVALLRDRRLKHDAREALIAFGESAIPALVHFLNDPDEQVWVRRAIPKTLARIDTPAARAALVENLASQPDPYLRRKMVEALDSAPRRPLPAQLAALVDRQIAAEARSYLRVLADREALRHPAGEPGLLEQLLGERLDEHLRNLFGLLGLLHSPADIWAAYRSLTAPGSPTRGHALEYLDNTLTGEQRRATFAAIDDRPLADKLATAERQLGIRRRDRRAVLRACLDVDPRDDADAGFLAAAALYAVYAERLEELYPEARRLTTAAEDAFVAETARWVVAGIDRQTAAIRS